MVQNNRIEVRFGSICKYFIPTEDLKEILVKMDINMLLAELESAISMKIRNKAFFNVFFFFK